jgi:sugar (pentulose or hexulose) kinase
MPESIVLVDFGASRIKSVQYSLTQKRVLNSIEHKSPTLRYGLAGEVEGNPEDYWRALEATAGQLIACCPEIEDIWICSEMHGFLLANYRNSNPITGYISWQDQRGLSYFRDKSNVIESVELLREKVFATSGMTLRPGLPIVNLSVICKSTFPLEPFRFLTLVDWLLLRGGETNPKCHPTLAAGTGLYSITQRDWSIDLLVAIGIDPSRVHMPEIGEVTSPLGTIELGGKKIRVWGGLGDLQSAAHGLDFPEKSSILINLGTGSQVMAFNSSPNIRAEIRPCVLGGIANAVTHIPSGRALNTFASFIDGCALQGGGLPLFWRLFGEMQPDPILAADACIDLNVFSAAWKYESGGGISKILESRFDLSWFMESLAKSWLVQYSQALKGINSDLPCSTFLLGGGLSRRGAFIAPVLESLIGKRAIETTLITGEETLDGLVKLAQSTI